MLAILLADMHPSRSRLVGQDGDTWPEFDGPAVLLLGDMWLEIAGPSKRRCGHATEGGEFGCVEFKYLNLRGNGPNKMDHKGNHYCRYLQHSRQR